MESAGFVNRFAAWHGYASHVHSYIFFSWLVFQRKYPEATDYAICSLIGGFFFLRFINPAIVTPQAYMLVEGVPAKHPRRTLTLVCGFQSRATGIEYWIESRLPKCYKILPTNPRMRRRHIWWHSTLSLKIIRLASTNFLIVCVRSEIFMIPWRFVLRFPCSGQE